MSRLSIAIMAVPERRALVFELLEILNKRVPVLWDIGHKGAKWNAERAWSSISGNATHHLVLQDDAIPCRNFISLAENALDHSDDALVTFFNPRKEIVKAKERGDSWVRMTSFQWAQATALPVGRVSQFLRWSKNSLSKEYPHDDVALGIFAELADLPIYCTVPNLVDHRNPKEVKSDLGHNTPSSRTSYDFLADQDGYKIDWSKGLKNPLIIRYPSGLNDYKTWLKKSSIKKKVTHE